MKSHLLSIICYLLSIICIAPASGATLDNLCTRIGFGVEEVSDAGCTLTNADDTLRFFAGGRRFELNRRSIWLNAPAIPDARAGFTFEYVDMVNLIAPLFAAPIATNRPFRVQLDAGHGGEDAGCISPHGGLYEKDLVLDVALRAGEILSSRGIEVIYSRTNDTFVSLAGRSGIAAKRKADAFVAVHANFAENQTARGIETFTLPFANMPSTSSENSVSPIARVGNANDLSNTILGHEIQRRMPGRLGESDRGLRHARFQVLRDTPCPAVLVEIGFLSNPTDSRNLSSNWYRDKIALAIADGVCAFSDRRRAAAVREKSKVESPKSKVDQPVAKAKETGNGERGSGIRERGSGIRDQESTTNTPLNRSTAQPLNPSTNLSGSALSAPLRETNAVPNRQTVKPSNCQTNAPLRETNAVPSSVTNALPSATNAVPSVTNAPPAVTNAVPVTTNAPSLSADISEIESRKPKAIECRRELSIAADYLLSPIPYLLSPIFPIFPIFPCSPLS